MSLTDDQADFVTDSEIIQRLNVPEKVGRAAIREFEKDHPGRPPFPQKDPIMGYRRFWPAVVNYFNLRHGLGGALGTAPQWQENSNGRRETSETGEAGGHRDAGTSVETTKEKLDRFLAAAAGPRRKVSHKKPTLVASVGQTDGHPH
jgi:hypothetical protein